LEEELEKEKENLPGAEAEIKEGLTAPGDFVSAPNAATKSLTGKDLNARK